MKLPFDFLDVPRLLPLVDNELELVEPAARHLEALLAACHHPLTQRDMPAQAQTTRESIQTFLNQNPRGHTPADTLHGIAPGYTFWMKIRHEQLPLPPLRNRAVLDVDIAGSISLRIGHSPNLDFYLGHIGYHVLPPARGHRFAERACRLLLPLARHHGHTALYITCNPDNLGSRTTCERLGATYLNTLPVPKENSLYSQGDRQKLRYRLDL
jgi:predicted acetyltransferase